MWTDKGIIGSAAHKTSTNSIGFGITQSLAVGDFVTAQLATDNATNTTGTTNTHTSMSCGGNTFTKVSEQTFGGGGTAGGVTLSVWRCLITTAVNAGVNITAGLSFSPMAKTFSGRCFAPEPGSTLTYSAAVVNTAVGPPAALTISNLDATKNIFLQRAAALESTATSISTATTGWTLGADVGTSGGNAATNMSTRSEYLLGTGATSYTSQPGGTSGDGVSIMFAVTETLAAAARRPSSYAFILE